MNHLIRCTTSLMVLALITTGITSAAEPNVLLKDSFEDGKKAPDGWKRGANLPGVRYVYDKGQGSTGDRSLSLQKTSKRYFPIAQWYRIFPYAGQQTSLRVSAQVRAEKVTKAILDVQFLDANGKHNGHQWVSYIGAKKAGDLPVNHDWREYSGEVSIPPKTKQIAIGLQIYGPGKIWFDDLEATFGNAAATEKPARTKPEKAIDVKAGKGVGQYLLVPSSDKTGSDKKHPLLIVLPGGDGSADFHPFVKRIHENALSENFILAQPIAK